MKDYQNQIKNSIQSYYSYRKKMKKWKTAHLNLKPIINLR